MTFLLSHAARLRSSWPVIGLILAVSAVPIGAVLFLHFWKGIPVGDLTRDPIIVLRTSRFYIGFLSQLGIFFWAASAAICMFSAKLLSRHPDSRKIKQFLFVSGLLTLALGLDDAFLLHEIAYPRHLGVPEGIVYVIYIGCVLFYLVGFYSVILKTEYILLGMAFYFFGVSMGLDSLFPMFPYKDIVEDGAKITGIVAWLAYFFRVGIFAIQQGAPADGYSTAP